MKRETADWLIGQVEAVRMLTDAVADTLKYHSEEAAKGLGSIRYACNRTRAKIEQAAEAGKGEL